jgi:hypothetical protein
MELLKHAVKLGEKIEIIVPGTTNTDQVADTSVYVDMALETLSELFGGATAVKASGAYVSDQAVLIQEQVTKVYAYADRITPEKLSEVLEFADRMKKELKQECIGLELNGSFYLV